MLARPGRAGVARVIGDQLVQTLGVEPAHVAHHVDPAVALEIAARMVMALHHLFLSRDRLEFDHRQVAALSEVAGLVEHVGDAARHAGGEIAPGLADDDDDPAGHVFAAVVARPLDDGDRARIAHAETLARDAAEVALRPAIAP